MSEPNYIKLYRSLREAIVNGDYPYGTRLPSKRTLAADKGVSLITAEHAYALLAEEGYILSRERSGFFVCYRGEEFFPVHETPLDPLPQNANALRDEFPFSVLAKTMRHTLSFYGEQLLQSSPAFGCAELRTALAEYLARSRSIRVSSDQIIIGSGAEYFYGLVVQLLGRDLIFGLESPSYQKIRQVYEAVGVQCEALTLGPDGILSEALAGSRAGVLHITPFHSYPSGVTASASKRAEYVRWAREHHAYIVEDDYDSEFTLSSKAEEPVFSRSPDGRVIYLNTFSRSIAPSLRAGYMVLPPALLEQFREKLGFYSCSVPVFEQYVLTELIRSGDFERHINRVRRRLRREKTP